MENQEQEINLGEIFYLLLSKLPFIILLGILGALCGLAVGKLVLPVKYTSSISIYVNNGSDASDATTDGKANTADLQASQTLASTYIVILDDDVVYDEVSKLLLEDYDITDLEKLFSVGYSDGEPFISASQIRSLVSISTLNDTEVISITATTENPQISADLCTYIADIAPELLTSVTKAGSVEKIGSAKVPTSPSSPNVQKITLIGLMLGIILAVAVVVIADLIDNRIKFAEDFKKRFPDIPVLSEIPDLNESKGGNKT